MCYDRKCLPKNILVWKIAWKQNPNAFIAQRSSKHILTPQVNLLSHAKAYLSTSYRLVKVRLVVRSMLPLVAWGAGGSNGTPHTPPAWGHVARQHSLACHFLWHAMIRRPES